MAGEGKTYFARGLVPTDSQSNSRCGKLEKNSPGDDMSQFITKLNQLTQASPQPIGFGARQTASLKPKLQLVASLSQENVEQLVDYVAGADAGLLRFTKPNSAVKAQQKIAQALSDIPCGWWLPEGGQREIKQMVKAGADFVVFPRNTPLTLLENEEIGKILAVEASLTEGWLRAANELPIDAVLITSEQPEEFLTWQHLLLFQRFADLLTKPLLVFVPADLTARELETLWATGVDGVVTEVTAEPPQNRLKELRQIIDNLTFPLPRRREKAEPLLPRLGGETSSPTTEEEEEEE